MNHIGKLAKASLMACLCLTASCTELGVEAGEETDTTIETVMASPAPLNGTFLHLSDIHFDPFADSSLIAKLDGADFTKWEGIFEAAGDKTFPDPPRRHHRKYDTNYSLLKSALIAAKAAGDYDYILYTGDYLAHDFVNNTPSSISDKQAFTTKTVSFVNWMIAKYLPNKPLVAALGNNDSDCGDYNLVPGADILSGVAKDLPLVNADSNATSSFDKGGYYTIPHPTVANHDFIVLSIFWSNSYWTKCGPNTDTPGADQLKWFSKTVSAAKTAGRKATVLMHIPPGVDGFSGYRGFAKPMWGNGGQFETGFEAAITSNPGTITGGFAGHTHMDEFRVLSSGGSPYLAVKMTPSVTPYNANFPSFTVYTYDTSDGSTKDYTTTAMTSYFKGMTGADANWKVEYSFSDYGVGDFTAANAEKLAKSIQTDGSVAAMFGKYYSAGNGGPASRSNDVKFFGCALNASTTIEYNSCINPASTAAQ